MPCSTGLSRSSSPRPGSGTAWTTPLRRSAQRWAGRSRSARRRRAAPRRVAGARADDGSLGDLLGCPVDVARFLPNVVLDVDGDGFPEEEWTGRDVRLGDEVVLRVGPAMPRCVMVGLPQRRLEKDKRILRTLAQERDLALGVQASVVRGGRVRVGDATQLL